MNGIYTHFNNPLPCAFASDETDDTVCAFHDLEKKRSTSGERVVDKIEESALQAGPNAIDSVFNIRGIPNKEAMKGSGQSVLWLTALS